jgi:hypothetical protein
MNARRCRLIEKEVRGTITQEESVALEALLECGRGY